MDSVSRVNSAACRGKEQEPRCGAPAFMYENDNQVEEHRLSVIIRNRVEVKQYSIYAPSLKARLAYV